MKKEYIIPTIALEEINTGLKIATDIGASVAGDNVFNGNAWEEYWTF